MTTHQPIGVVKSIEGFVTAGDHGGVYKALGLGDIIYADDLLHLEHNAGIVIHFIDGGIRSFEGESFVDIADFGNVILDNAQIDIDSLQDSVKSPHDDPPFSSPYSENIPLTPEDLLIASPSFKIPSEANHFSLLPWQQPLGEENHVPINTLSHEGKNSVMVEILLINS